MPKKNKNKAKSKNSKMDEEAQMVKPEKSKGSVAMNSFDESHDGSDDSDEITNTNMENSRNDNILDSDDDSDSDDEVSDLSDSDYEDESQINDKKVKTKFLENVIKYLKADDIIKKKNKEHKEDIKNLKDEKNELEGFIIRYLDRKGETHVNIKGEGKLIKNKSETKAPIKAENIREGILEGLKAEKLVEEEEKALELINLIIDKIDSKRTVTTRTYLKRTKANGKGKKKDKDKKKK